MHTHTIYIAYYQASWHYFFFLSLSSFLLPPFSVQSPLFSFLVVSFLLWRSFSECLWVFVVQCQSYRLVGYMEVNWWLKFPLFSTLPYYVEASCVFYKCSCYQLVGWLDFLLSSTCNELSGSCYLLFTALLNYNFVPVLLLPLESLTSELVRQLIYSYFCSYIKNYRLQYAASLALLFTLLRRFFFKYWSF